MIADGSSASTIPQRNELGRTEKQQPLETPSGRYYSPSHPAGLQGLSGPTRPIQ
jgi:hypothetical protein